jgi:SAM-dependent methyltransferase
MLSRSQAVETTPGETASINYDHSNNLHSTIGAELAFCEIMSLYSAKSILDVGCGIGTWLRAAIRHGISDVIGIDGVNISDADLLFPRCNFQLVDLTTDWVLGRRFDLVLCLEVAEHLDCRHARSLIKRLTDYGNVVVFSAAIPGQRGQNHVNCQWPAYWQNLFNDCGFVCSDALRWKIWNMASIEPWYRQNVMVCEFDSQRAGQEPRIQACVHPDMLTCMLNGSVASNFEEHVQRIESGALPLRWYAFSPIRAVACKFRRFVRWHEIQA